MRVSSACLGPLGTNSYLIEHDGLVLLVDPAEEGARLNELISGRKVDWVILTHGHFDHVGGAWSVPGARIGMHQADLPFVDQAFPNHGPIDAWLQDGDLILPGVDVLHMPGHSPGSMVLAIEDALFVGDVLFAGSIGRTDFPGGSMQTMMESLRRMAALPGEYRVFPGHGEPTTLDTERRSNPYLQMLR